MKIFLLVGCTVWFITAAVGQKVPVKEKTGPSKEALAKTSAEGKNSASENTLLWEISGNGLQTPSHLFGTMHILCADDAQLSDNLKKVIKNTKLIYFEIDLDNLVEMMGALKYVRMNDNKKLSDIL